MVNRINNRLSESTSTKSTLIDGLNRKNNLPFDTLYGNINGTNIFTPIHPATASVSNTNRVNQFPKSSSTIRVQQPSQNWYNVRRNIPSNIHYSNIEPTSVNENLQTRNINNKMQKKFKFLDYFTFTSYTTMTLIILSITIHALDYFAPFLHLTDDYFTTHTKVEVKQWHFLELFQMFSYILGHSSWDHLLGNTSQILILGNIIEEKFGSIKLAKMILITALTGSCATFLVNAFNVHLRGLNYGYTVRGASGIVYSFWVLASVVGNKSGKIPLELLIVLSIILTSSVFNFYWYPSTNISHMGHVIGGITGGVLGLIYAERQ